MANNTDWLNISQMTGGTGETALSLTALTNTSLQPKTATITARNTQYNVSDTTTVTIQGFQPTLTLSRSTLRFDSTGGTATFTVYSNTSWTIQFPPIVQSYSVSAGTGNMEVSVVLAPNPDEVAKVDTGLVKDIYNVNQLYLTIVQESFIVELSVEPDDDITFANTGSTTSVTVDCNTDWELYYPSWVTPSVTSGSSGTTTVTFTAPENGQTDRSGQITVYAGSKEVTLNVFQPFYIPPYITVTPSAWIFNYTEDGKTFVVDSYPEWTAEVISTGETVWGSQVYMEATFVIPSAMTMNLYYSLPTGTDIYFGPVKQLSSSITFDTPGTYKIRYEIPSGGTAPSLRGNTYLTDLYFTDGIGALSEGAFSGCSSLSGIITDCVTAPSICANTFYGVATGGTLIYPAESDYSTWLARTEHYLGYNFWNNLSPDFHFAVTVTYNVTSTGNTKILADYSNGGGDLDYPIKVNFVRDEQGNITPLRKGQTTFQFSSTGKQRLDLSIVERGVEVEMSGVPATDIIINDIDEYAVLCTQGNEQITGLTLYHNLHIQGSHTYLRYFKTTGSTDTFPPTENTFTSGSVRFYSLLNAEIFGHITELPDYAFEFAEFTSITLNEEITKLGSSCFKDCSSLQIFTIPSGVTYIGSNCFRTCSSLQSIIIPSGVTRLYSSTFKGCSSLESITCYATTAPTISSDTFQNVKTNGVLYYPTGSDYSTWFAKLPSGWTGQEI